MPAPILSFGTIQKREDDYGDGMRYLVIACFSSLIRSETPLQVDDCYEAHDLLVKRKVVPQKPNKQINWDHESCCNYYYFATKKRAEQFVEKFNKAFNEDRWGQRSVRFHASVQFWVGSNQEGWKRLKEMSKEELLRLFSRDEGF